tara:strand:- start:345 stop:503 length:159 start_codon:yes stop_codon:yes gene_type:complete
MSERRDSGERGARHPLIEGAIENTGVPGAHPLAASRTGGSVEPEAPVAVASA